MAQAGVERDPARMSALQTRVQEFMLQGGQRVPLEAEMPTVEERHRMAKLILEEALEAVEALGFEACDDDTGLCIEIDNIDLVNASEPNFEKIIDGAADTIVVSQAILCGCGVDDVPILREVMRSNMTKFREGWYRRDDGKIVKSPLYEPAMYSVVEAFKAKHGKAVAP